MQGGKRNVLPGRGSLPGRSAHYMEKKAQRYSAARAAKASSDRSTRWVGTQ